MVSESFSKWPLESTSFGGRQHELAQLGLASTRNPLVTLIGPNGVGKTRLALHWLRQQYAGKNVLRLACRDLVTSESLTALTQAHEAEVKRLGEAGGTLLLDGLDGVVDDAQKVVGRWLLHCPKLSVLTTSTRRLGLLAEHLLVVGPLSTQVPKGAGELSPAAKLYLERAVASGAPAPPDNDAAQALVTALQGLPLLIEMAAEKAGVLGPDEFLRRRSEWLDLWRSPIADREASQRSVRANLALVYAELAPSARLTWQLCSVFAASFSVASLQTLWTAYHAAETRRPPNDSALLLEQVQLLLERSLLSSSDSDALVKSYKEEVKSPDKTRRFQLLDHLRLFAREQANLEGHWSQLCGLHASWMAERATAALGDTESTLSLETSELTQALDTAQNASQKLCLARALIKILTKRGSKSALNRAEHSLLQSTGPAGQPEGLGSSVFLEHFGNEDALALGEFALELAGSHLSYGAIESAASWIAQAELALPLPQEARAGNASTGAPSPPERSGIERARIDLLRAQAGLARARGDSGGAESLFLQALSSTEGYHDSFRARVLTSYAGWLFEQERIPEAEQRYMESLALHRHQKSSAMEGVTLNNLALLAQHSEEWSKATSLITQALAIHRKFGHRRFEGIALGDLGTVALEQGALRLAARLCGAAARILALVGDDLHKRLALATQSVALALLGETELTREVRSRALLPPGTDTPREGQSAALETAIFVHVETSALLESLNVLRPGAQQRPERPVLDSRSTVWNAEVQEHAEHSDEVRLARRIARRCQDWACATEGTLVLSVDGDSARMPNGSLLDLSDKLALARLLEALAVQRLIGNESGLSAGELVALAWPGEKISPAAAKNRLHVAISKLRKLGLGNQLQQLKGSYLLGSDLPLLVCSTTP